MGYRNKPAGFIFAAFFLILVLVSIPVSCSANIRGNLASLLKAPLVFSGETASWLGDFFNFRKNAADNRVLRQVLARQKLDKIQSREIRLENERLTKLLEMRFSATSRMDRVLYARVIARSPLAWNRTLWIDKGFDNKMRENMPVFSGDTLIGKIIEVRRQISKVILLTDPNCRIGALLAANRQQGILSGTAAGECRMKYIPVDTQVKAGDLVETAGLGVFFPKGIPVGTVTRFWKEPGQIYQVALVKPLADLAKIEEVGVLDVR